VQLRPAPLERHQIEDRPIADGEVAFRADLAVPRRPIGQHRIRDVIQALRAMTFGHAVAMDDQREG